MNESQILKFYEKLSEMSERIARMETMLLDRENEGRRIAATLDEHDKRITSLEGHTAKFFGAKEFIAWGIAVTISVIGVMMK